MNLDNLNIPLLSVGAHPLLIKNGLYSLDLVCTAKALVTTKPYNNTHQERLENVGRFLYQQTSKDVILWNYLL